MYHIAKFAALDIWGRLFVLNQSIDNVQDRIYRSMKMVYFTFHIIKINKTTLVILFSMVAIKDSINDIFSVSKTKVINRIILNNPL